MKLTNAETSRLAAEIAEAEDKLEVLAREIEEIGQPAGAELSKRLEALKIEERALKRNVEELLSEGEASEGRIHKIEALLAHIRSEESQLEQEAGFLHQGAPSSVELVARAGSRVLELCQRAIRRVLGDSMPLGSSVFVNHTHEDLVKFHGLSDDPKS